MNAQIILDASVKPATRTQAFQIIQEAIQSERQLEREELEALFKHFAPNISSKAAKTPEQWAAKAVAGPKDVRYYLQYLHSDGKHLYATDGHRIHWIPTTLEAGFYDPKTLQPVKLDATYPNVLRVIPEHSGPLVTYIHKDCPLDTDKTGKWQQQSLDGVLFNPKYLADASNGTMGIHVELRGPTDPIRGKSEFGEFVVMPLRPKPGTTN